MKSPVGKLELITVVTACFAQWAVRLVDSGAVSSRPAVTHSDFSRVDKYRVFQSDQSGSYLRCAAACLKEDNCMYFSYSKAGRRCELCDSSTVPTNEKNLTYYTRITGDFSCSVEERLGIESGRIPDESLSASSSWRDRVDHGPLKARLNRQGPISAWQPQDGDRHPWIQVDFNGRVTVTGVISQGRADQDKWVKAYRVTYSDDGVSWRSVADADATPIEFPGNNDRNSLVTSRFPAAIRTKLLRIHPTAWHSFCCFRFEVIGCY